jgi:hypothetical protein
MLNVHKNCFLGGFYDQQRPVRISTDFILVYNYLLYLIYSCVLQYITCVCMIRIIVALNQNKEQRKFSYARVMKQT